MVGLGAQADLFPDPLHDIPLIPPDQGSGNRGSEDAEDLGGRVHSGFSERAAGEPRDRMVGIGGPPRADRAGTPDETHPAALVVRCGAHGRIPFALEGLLGTESRRD